MSNLIKCECCEAKISEDSVTCKNCGHPINLPKTELLFAYEYDGETLNFPLYRDDISKLDILQKIRKVELDDKVYKIVDFICSAHNETIRVLLEDVES